MLVNSLIDEWWISLDAAPLTFLNFTPKCHSELPSSTWPIFFAGDSSNFFSPGTLWLKSILQTAHNIRNETRATNCHRACNQLTRKHRNDDQNFQARKAKMFFWHRFLVLFDEDVDDSEFQRKQNKQMFSTFCAFFMLSFRFWFTFRTMRLMIFCVFSKYLGRSASSSSNFTTW